MNFNATDNRVPNDLSVCVASARLCAGERSRSGGVRSVAQRALTLLNAPLRRVQQCERSRRARCTGTYLYTLCIKPGSNTSRARRALTLLNEPLVYWNNNMLIVYMDCMGSCMLG